MSKVPFHPSQAPWSRQTWTKLHTTRTRRWLRVTTLLAILLGGFHLLSECHKHRAALRQKFSPTDFSSFTSEEAILAGASWKWGNQLLQDNGTAYSREELYANREEWTRLGSGSEGEALMYNDTVIKVYKSVRFPFRNCVPNTDPELRWPTEIAASLLLGGVTSSKTAEDFTDFLPVTDYFLSEESDGSAPRWHFVTPYLPSGNLVKLAKHLRTSASTYTARQLDTAFRPSLERLLDSLNRMHVDYDVCHDDVKPDNVFLASSHALDEANDGLKETRKWILADLGNVREPSHPYHSSILWSSLNDNLADCRVNDISRLLKSYMTFLRDSVDDVPAFDDQFLEGREPWSRFFWQTWDAIQARQLISADTVKTGSAQIHPTSDASERAATENRGFSEPNSFYQHFLSKDYVRARAVRETLKISASDKVSRRWGLTPWLLGVPVGLCQS